MKKFEKIIFTFVLLLGVMLFTKPAEIHASEAKEVNFYVTHSNEDPYDLDLLRNVTIPAGSVLEKPADLLYRQGYILKGWSDTFNGPNLWIFDDSPLDLGDNYYVNLYTVWKECPSISVTLDPNGGNGSPINSTMYFGDGEDVPDINDCLPRIFNKDPQDDLFYYQAGWGLTPNTQPDDPTAFFNIADPIIEKDSRFHDGMTLYAVWKTMDFFPIVYDPNGGTGTIASAKLYMDGSVMLSDGSGFKKFGQTITGWEVRSDPQHDLNQQVFPISTFISVGRLWGKPEVSYETLDHVTLYAVWEPISKVLPVTSQPTWTGDTGSSGTSGSPSNTVSASINANFDSFEFVELLDNNGNVVDPINYTVTRGSIVITFKDEYLKSLSQNGIYSFKAILKGLDEDILGLIFEADIKLDVDLSAPADGESKSSTTSNPPAAASGKNTSPPTGDNASLSFFGLLIIGFFTLYRILIYKREKTI